MHGFAHNPLVPLCDKSWELSRGVTIGRCRFLAWRLAARGARVFADSMLPLVLCQATFFMQIGHIGGGGIVSSRNTLIEDESIRTETESTPAVTRFVLFRAHR